jgi:hypothetical protein
MTTQTTTRKVKRIDPLTLAKVLTITYGLGGLIGSFLMAIAKAGDFGFFIGFIVGFTAVYTLVGFLSGLIGAFLYNVAAKYTGGISVEIE